MKISTLMLCLLLWSPALASPEILPPGRVQELLKEGALLVDVRSLEEYRSGHLPEALHIPHAEIAERLDQLPDTSAPIVLYCASGRRSGIAAQVLREKGYERVFNAGGYKDLQRWSWFTE